MKQAFVVSLNVPDNSPDTVVGIAADIEELLNEGGLQVMTVNPWNSPGTPDTIAPNAIGDGGGDQSMLPGPASPGPLW